MRDAMIEPTMARVRDAEAQVSKALRELAAVYDWMGPYTTSKEERELIEYQAVSCRRMAGMCDDLVKRTIEALAAMALLRAAAS